MSEETKEPMELNTEADGSAETRKKTQDPKRRKRKKRRKKKKNPFVTFLKFIGGLFLVLLIVGMIGIIAGSVMLYPEFESISQEMTEIINQMDSSSFVRAGNTEIYDAKGTLIGQYGNEKYVYVDYNDISPYVINGYISTEDERFYSHIGFDVQGTLRAAIALVKNKGTITQGGSTITQQLVKNNLLTQERSYRRKILEIILAVQLERIYTKEEILELYCNSCYYGKGCYGIEGAANYYFGKSAADLTAAEAAILCGTSNSPNNYNPVADYTKATAKKKQILTNMRDQGYITEKEFNEAYSENPKVKEKTSSGGFADTYQNSYTVHCAALILMKQSGFEFRYTFNSEEDYNSYKESYDALYSEMADEVRNGGYTIKTSLNSSIQEQLQMAVDRNLAAYSDTADDGRYKFQGAAVCIDNSSQMVVAIVGGRTADDTYNRGFLAVRQPGSSIKPLLDYGPALDTGVATPATVINDKRIELDGYAPKNAGGSSHGDVTMREALNRSLNTVAFKLFLATGPEKCFSYLDSMHFSSLTYEDSIISSISIGGFSKGVRVCDMARGFATIANGGEYSENTCIVSIDHYSKGNIYKASRETTPIYSADTAYMLTDMLEGVFRESYGTAHSHLDLSQVYAGKTGTTNNNKDAWFCGFSAYYTTAVWVGMDMPEPVDDLKGNTYPAYIWTDFMSTIHAGLERKDFVPTDSLYLVEEDTGIHNAVTVTDNVYDARPYGWDYASGKMDYDNTLVDFKEFFDDEKYELTDKSKD